MVNLNTVFQIQKMEKSKSFLVAPSRRPCNSKVFCLDYLAVQTVQLNLFLIQYYSHTFKQNVNV